MEEFARMYRNVTLDAHLAALLFLGATALLLFLLVTALFCFVLRRQWLRYCLLGAAGLAISYALLLAGFSAFSREHTLSVGEEKYFCELDCHVAYSVQRVEHTKRIGGVVANGEFYVVTLRSRLDETTTASWRPRDVPVKPDPLRFTLVDGHGDVIGTSPAGQQAWEDTHAGSPSLFHPLLPGESTTATFVFDVPPGMHDPRLLASFGVFPTQVLIGDESSFLHRKTYFGI
jgi:hypothetical protein